MVLTLVVAQYDTLIRAQNVSRVSKSNFSNLKLFLKFETCLKNPLRSLLIQATSMKGLALHPLALLRLLMECSELLAK